ncbi:serine/threonine-protein kinase [Microlunatus panaciterrae]|uniref:non-specific serine/threonine protein kinase n=1 Tax=Microlunatus panaciterrae TaxID=400768 RepID=A0ABS2RET8_9ACTN|nr:serine/threonine-protein kinase [Microlunatus panaciterrae]MBM7797520.1 serine/threonine-protein kinase PknG [Microlunatus panaciterrae]
MSTPVAPTRCTQPGCTGSILDGYCDVCGSPAEAPATAGGPAQAPATASGRTGPTVALGRPAAADGQRCRRPGCTGTILDGYCDVCGMEPDQGVAVEQQEGSGSAPLSTITRGSSRLDSIALGSKRATASGSTITRRIHPGSARLRSARLGAGLTRVPPMPVIDASRAIMKDPQVPEHKRNCPRCGAPVGRSRAGEPGRTEGFCPKCRNPFSFNPKLKPGDLVAHQYEVAGCLAHGGLGWIYLARDKNVSDRWVVLKGLLNTGDADALAVAIAEQRFLAQVEHPQIVEIYNFVTHEDAGYIVMEFVGGTSLKQLLKERMRANNGEYDPLPVDQAIAYILEVLPAFQYLHDLGLVYCDFKPDNLIQVGDDIKLIDLGGVRRLDDEESAIYGTVGYQAPEVAEMGTTVASDIYTIGRTLLVLMMEFRGYQTTYVDSLPPVDQTPLFQQHDSLYRLLAKACAPDPADRFASVDELRVQLLGVLREEVGRTVVGTAATSAASMLFESPAITSDVLEWDELPALRQDTTDPQYAWLSNIGIDDPAARFEALLTAPETTAEVQLARARTALQLRRAPLVEQVVEEMLAADPWEWRAVWIAGLSALQRGDIRSAQSSFNAVYGQVPGELAPKLALGLACERGGEPVLAESMYGICASTDANYVAAGAFGMARVRADRGDIDGAVAALDLVPPTSRGYIESRRQRAVHLYASGGSLESLSAAMASIASVQLDPADRAQFTIKVLHKALDAVRSKGPQQKIRIGSYAAVPQSLHDGLEHTYRELARMAPDDETRVAMVDRANEFRRWSLR